MSSDFRTERYAMLNACRWEHFDAMGIGVDGKTILELGAGNTYDSTQEYLGTRLCSRTATRMERSAERK